MQLSIPAHLIAAAPATPVAAYQGGKRNLARLLIARLAAMPAHTLYAEVFVGMGGVFFRRPFRSRAEAINDVNRDVANLFRVLQVHYVAFLDMMRFQLTSRAEFDRLSAENPASLTDMQRAARFLYLQRTTFGGKIVGQSFGVSPGIGARFDITRLPSILEAVHDRLAAVTIECLPWERFVPRYDRPETLFYLDPPYYGGEGDYGAGVFARDDFARMAEMLAGLRGHFVMSLNDHPEVRRLFAAFQIEAVETTYSISAGAASRVREVVISNAPPG